MRLFIRCYSITTNQPTHTMIMNSKYKNLGTILKGGKEAEVFLVLPKGQTISIVDSPRKREAYLVRPAIGEGDARALLVDSMKRRGTPAEASYQFANWLKYLMKQFPEGISLFSS